MLVIRDTAAHVAAETAAHPDPGQQNAPAGSGPAAGTAAATRKPFRVIFLDTSWRNLSLRGASQAGLVNNLNDGLTWAVSAAVRLPRAGASRDRADQGRVPAAVGRRAAAHRPAVRHPGAQAADRVRELVQAAAFPAALALPSRPLVAGLASAVLLGAGTAMVYPALIASVADHTHPSWRAQGLGVYRFSRDLGYAAGAVIAGLVAGAFGLSAAVVGRRGIHLGVRAAGGPGLGSPAATAGKGRRMMLAGTSRGGLAGWRGWRRGPWIGEMCRRRPWRPRRSVVRTRRPGA